MKSTTMEETFSKWLVEYRGTQAKIEFLKIKEELTTAPQFVSKD
jgi:hypothetical protein